jgi:hypothetical protein
MNRSDHFDTGLEAHDEIEGWKAAVAKLSGEGIVDPARVGIAGFSRTCWQVEEALISVPTLFHAAVVADGLDLSYMTYRLLSPSRPSMAKEYEKMIGAKPEGKGLEAWIESAPGFHLDKVVTPLRIEAIGKTSILTEWETYSSLEEQHKPVDLIYIPRGQHILQKPWDRLASQQGTIDWFRFWLQGYEDPAIEKRSQYQRWRRLRERASEPADQHRGDEVPSPPQG